MNENAYFVGGVILRNNEVEVKEVIDQFEFLLRGSDHVFFYIHDPDHYWEYISPSISSILGYSPDELLGQKFEFLLRGDPTDKVVKEMTKAALLKGNQMPTYKTVLRHKSGHGVELEILETPVIRKGKVTGIQGFAIDITEQRRVEDLLVKSEKLSLIGQLAAGVAHEVRNPLTSIKGFFQLMKDEFTEESNKFEKYFSVIETELDRINLIVSEFLFLSKPQAKKMEVKDICEILDTVILLFETETNMKSIKVWRHYKNNHLSVLCEQNQLKQVFINLLKNSVDASDEGGNIYVSVEKTEDDKVHICFQDEGCGIPKEALAKLGEPFYTTKADGTGLGVMISYKIIKDHQGVITISSEENMGTTVDIILPLVKIET